MRKGVSLLVSDIRSEPVDLLAAEGAAPSSIQEIAERCAIIFTMVPDDAASEAVIIGGSGLSPHIKAGTLVVDMSRTTFCDTAGIHALVSAHKQAQAGRGELRLVITTPMVRRIFTITGLDNLIPHFVSREDALTAPFNGPGNG